MRILCYGDSDTFGHDPRSPLGEPYPPEVRWTDRLAAATGWEERAGDPPPAWGAAGRGNSLRQSQSL